MKKTKVCDLCDTQSAMMKECLPLHNSLDKSMLVLDRNNREEESSTR